ncbi:LOW QUALITY PROTEIN: lipoprotein lpqJ, partial [Mycobacterium tuberculosis T92]
MRLSLIARGMAALLAATALVAGCNTTIDGRPVASPGSGPTEPTFPTPRPTTAPPGTTAPTLPTTPVSPTAPAGAIPLPPDSNGYVFIETKSGMTRARSIGTALAARHRSPTPPCEMVSTPTASTSPPAAPCSGCWAIWAPSPPSASTTEPMKRRAGPSTPPPMAPASRTTARAMACSSASRRSTHS